MAERKTQKTAVSVDAFLAQLDHEAHRDSRALVALMRRVTRAAPRMWGPSIVGFGDHSYTTADGKEHDWFLAGFSPRKGTLVIYAMGGLRAAAAELKALGKHRATGSCLYVRRLADVDPKVLERVVRLSVEASRAKAAPAKVKLAGASKKARKR